MEKLNEEKLIKLGGKLWEGYGKRRIYFNNLEQFLGLDVSYYKTGNVSSANLNGQSISNSEARRILNQVEYGKLFYDLDTGKFGSKDLSDEIIEQIIKKILEMVNEPTNEIDELKAEKEKLLAEEKSTDWDECALIGVEIIKIDRRIKELDPNHVTRYEQWIADGGDDSLR